MRAAYYERTGPARTVFSVAEVATPTPGAGEVRVRIAYSGVNPSDVKTRAGLRGARMPFPRIVPHSDGAGVIDAVGRGVAESRVGQSVWLWNAAWQRPDGTAAEYTCVPANQAVPLPDGTDLAVGACIGVPVLTAYHAVAGNYGVSGKRVLVTGGAGAVGHYAIQIARELGAAQIISTVSTDEKRDIAEAAGADAILNYRREDVGAACRELTGGRGVDRVIDVDIAANLVHDLAALAPGGEIVAYGSGAADVTVPFFPAILAGVTLRFFIVYELPVRERDKANAAVTALLSAGRLKHNIALRLPLARIAEAHEIVEQGTAAGRVVLEIA